MYIELTDFHKPCEALYFDNPRLYFDGRKIHLWEADPWPETDRSWFETSYIHAGISGPETTYAGPDAQRMLSESCINDVYHWEPGTCKHLVMLNDDGLILNHALYMRDSEDVFRTTAGGTFPLAAKVESGSFDVTMSRSEVFILQFSGPLSLTILEKLTQCDLHDLGFLRYRAVSVPGIDAELAVYRIGMSGTLAYELHGPMEFGPAAYDAAFMVGREYGIKRLGWRDYTVNHTFGGFPQLTVHFETAWTDRGQLALASLRGIRCTGSVDPADQRARYRTAVETDWAWMADMGHDFTGKAALQRELASPKRKLVSLVWNPEDIVEVFASQFTDDPYKYMEMPCSEQQCGGHQDYVMSEDGDIIGYSSAAAYSSWYHQTVSLAILDVDKAHEGSDVLVQWGDFGKKIKNMRAAVARYPFLHGVATNQSYDVSTVPYGI